VVITEELDRLTITSFFERRDELPRPAGAGCTGTLGKPLFPPQIPAGPVELVGAKTVFANAGQFAAIEFGSSTLVVFGHTHGFGALGWVRHFSRLPQINTGQFHQFVIGLQGIGLFTCRLGQAFSVFDAT